MSAEIGPGTLLVCVKKTDFVRWPSYNLTVGSIYRCKEVVEAKFLYPSICPFCGKSHDAIRLAERDHTSYSDVLRSAIRFGYCPTFFRPLNDGDTSLVEDELDQPQETTDAPLELV